MPLFDRTPASPVIAQPYPQFQEANAQASYAVPAADGSRPGNLSDPRRVQTMTKFGLRTIVYHETIPGHHFQIALQPGEQGPPLVPAAAVLRRSWGSDTKAGASMPSIWPPSWAGTRMTSKDCSDSSSAEEFRARRLVVDTGLHAKRWTRQQAIDYGIEPAEVERYVVNPGQATSYMIGQLKIIEQREKARRALGDRFSLRAFHGMVLRNGALPLELLERQTDAFIARGGVL